MISIDVNDCCLHFSSLFGDDNHVEDTLGISFNKDETKDIKKKSSKVDLLDDVSVLLDIFIVISLLCCIYVLLFVFWIFCNGVFWVFLNDEFNVPFVSFTSLIME